MAKKKKPVSTKTRLRSAIRKIWMYSSIRRDALAVARIERGKYKCSKCSKICGPKEIEIDHITPATHPDGLDTEAQWGYFIWNLLFITVDKLEALCEPCHLEKTNREKTARKERNAQNKK